MSAAESASAEPTKEAPEEASKVKGHHIIAGVLTALDEELAQSFPASDPQPHPHQID